MSTPHAGCEVARICLQVLPCPAKNSMNVSSFRCMLLSIYMQGCAHACNDAGAHVPWTAFFKIAPQNMYHFFHYIWTLHLYAGNENGCASIHVYIHACLNVYMYIYIYLYICICMDMHADLDQSSISPESVVLTKRVQVSCKAYQDDQPNEGLRKFMDGQGMPHVWHLSC